MRYPSDMTDPEWAVVRPLIRPAKRGGRPRTVDVREELKEVAREIRTGRSLDFLPDGGGFAADQGRT